MIRNDRTKTPPLAGDWLPRVKVTDDPDVPEVPSPFEEPPAPAAVLVAGAPPNEDPVIVAQLTKHGKVQEVVGAPSSET